MAALPPLALYIHIPWCVRKCPYCDFNSHTHAQTDIPENAYVEHLLADLRADLPLAQGRPLGSIFFGGGTPSLLSGGAIARILRGVAAELDFAADIEITLEANPGTAEAGRFAAYAEAGVNRLSLGVQSFDALQLQRLGRIHDPEQAMVAVAMARSAGIERINIDLMHGLPGQTVAGALADLAQARALGVTHLSWYQLTIEPNTAFYSRPPVLPEDEALWAIQEQGLAAIAAMGLQQYEVSAYAIEGQAARHNLNYWQFGDYLGIGAGAHGKLSYWQQDQWVVERLSKTRLPGHYLARAAGQVVAERQRISTADLPFEFMMNALRLKAGVASELYPARTGLPLSGIEPVLETLRRQGLLTSDPARLQTSERGFWFLNDVLEAFMAADEKRR